MQNTIHTIGTNGIITTEFHGTIRGIMINNSSLIIMIIELYEGKTLAHIAQKIDILSAMSSEGDYLSDLSTTELGNDFIRGLSGKIITIIIEHFPYEESQGNNPIVLGEHAHAHPHKILLAGSKNEEDIFF